MGKTVNDNNYGFEAWENLVPSLLLNPPVGTDANNYKTPSTYFFPVIGGENNIPSGKSGLLVVVNSSAFAGDVWQYFFATDGTVHSRHFDGYSWSSWVTA